MGIGLHHLAVFDAIARERTFNGAAERLDESHADIRRQLDALELVVGARLVALEARHGALTLTPAGERLAVHAREIVGEYRLAQGKLAVLASRPAGSLRVGACRSVATELLPRIAEVFASICPGCPVIPITRSTEAGLCALLERGRVDLALCERPVLDGPFASADLLEDPFVLLVSATSSLTAGEPTLDAVMRQPLVAYNASRAQDRLLDDLIDQGYRPQVSYRADRDDTLHALVASDLGVALVPRMAVDADHPGTEVIELPELPTRTIALLWRRDPPRSSAAERFCAVARTVVPRVR